MTLTLDLEDTAKTCSLLSSQLDRTAKSGEKLQKSVGEKYRKEFKEQTLAAKNELEAKLNEADSLTAQKRTLAGEVRELQGLIAAADEKVKSAVSKVAEAGKRERNEQAASWGEGEAIRREKWLERKTAEIREITIKGLEPEVERIIDRHRQEVEEAERETEGRKKEWLLKHFDGVEDGKAKMSDRARKKYDAAVKVTRAAGNDRLTDVHTDHASNLVKLRQKLQAESDGLRNWQQEELKRLAEAHADECSGVRGSEGKRLADMRRRWSEEVEAGERGAQSALDGMEVDGMAAREQWENKVRSKIMKEALDSLEKEREELKARRDGEIERAIRKGQAGVSEKERSCSEAARDKEREGKADHDKRVKGIADKKNRWVEKIAESVDMVRELRDERSRHGKTLVALEEYSQKLDDDISQAMVAREELKAALVEKEDRAGESKKKELKLLVAERGAAERDIAAQRKRVEGMVRTHKDKVRQAEEEHEKDLEAIERRVKIEVGAKERKIRELQEVIDGQLVRCDHAAKMSGSYRNRRVKKERAGGSGGSPKRQHF